MRKKNNNKSMSTQEHTESCQIDIRSLLKLKCHERPNQEFWNDFERDFKHRALTHLCKGEQKLNDHIFTHLTHNKLVWSFCGLLVTILLAVFIFHSYPVKQEAFDTTPMVSSGVIQSEQVVTDNSPSSSGVVVAKRVENENETKFIVDTLNSFAVDEGRNFTTIHSMPPVLDATPDRSVYVDNGNLKRAPNGFSTQTVGQHF